MPVVAKLLISIASLMGLVASVWLLLAARHYRRFVRQRREIGNELRQLARSLPPAPDSRHELAVDDPPQGGGLRGIVLCAGGRGLLSQAYTNLDAIRRLHGCQLPVELFYSGSAEMSESSRSFFR